ncbi:MAG TPA: hypothetical protein VF451_01565 [Acidobacteriota bacterium]
MSDWQEIFEHSGDPGELDGDFAARVFAKIKKKKQQRKVGFAALAVAGVIMLLSLFQLFRPFPGRAQLPGGAAVKQEIPVSEDLFFSASDNRTRYSLEPVAYQRKTAAQAAVPNQI